MSDQQINSPLPSRPVDVPPPTPTISEPTTVSSSQLPVKKPLPLVPLLILPLIALLLIIFFVFVFPKIKTGGKPSVTTINYWGLWEDRSIMEGVIADFEAKNPTIKVNYKVQQITDYRTRLAGRLAKDPSVDEVPDIFRIHSSWLPMFADNIALVPDNTAKTIGLDTDFYDVYKADLKRNGKYQAIPLMYDGLSLFYNQDLIEKAQVTIPKTWWDFQTITNKITVRDNEGRITIAGVAMGLTDNVDHWEDIVGLILKQNGADITKSDQINNDKIIDVITYFTNFKKTYATWDETMSSSTDAFIKGKLAFYFAPSWRILNIIEANPQLRFAVTTVPQLATVQNESPNSNANLTNIHWASYWVEAVNSQSPNQKSAWKFLEYLASVEGLEKLYAAAAQTRSFGEIYPRKSLATKLNSNSQLKPFFTVADNAESGYPSSRTFDSGLNSELAKYFADAINKVSLNQAEPSTTLTDLRSGINQVIQKYQLK